MAKTTKRAGDENEVQQLTGQPSAKKPEALTRKCGFVPQDHMITIQGNYGPEWYLKVQQRVLWFNIYCEEKGIKGFIDESEQGFFTFPPNPAPGQVTYLFYIATVSIFMDNEVVAKSTVTMPVDFANEANFYNGMKTAMTQAKGRALANCGFGTAGASTEDGLGEPCDAGVPVPQNMVVAQVPQNQHPTGMQVPDSQMPQPQMTPQFQQAPMPVPPVTQPPVWTPPQVSTDPVEPQVQVPPAVPVQPMNPPIAQPAGVPAPVDAPSDITFGSVEEAANYLVPVGDHKGKTVAQLRVDDPKLFGFCVDGKMKAKSWRGVVAAAKMLVEAEK